MLGRFTGYLVFFLGAAIALQTIGIRATTLAAFGAALGVGIGFGLQDVVKNFVAGLILLIERPFQVGDRIEIEKIAAEVVEIRARATVLRTNDDVHLIVPNAKFITDTVTNRTYGRPIYRCHVQVPVAFDADPRVVQEALIEAARRCEGVLPDPPPAVRFRDFGESTLRFELLCWTARMVHRPGALISDHFPGSRDAPAARRCSAVLADRRPHPGRRRHETCRIARGGDAMNKDERQGKLENLKGRVKEAAGTLADDPDLEKEGADERAEGAARETVGRARRKVGEAVEELGERIKR